MSRSFQNVGKTFETFYLLLKIYHFVTVTVPSLKELVTGKLTFNQKYQFLAFITDNIIDEQKLKLIPVEYLTQVIVLVHLVNNESLQVFEALAISQTLKDVFEEKIPRALIFPKKINIRALRTSFLYMTMYYLMTRCLSTVGLQSLIVSISIIQGNIYSSYYAISTGAKLYRQRTVSNSSPRDETTISIRRKHL